MTERRKVVEGTPPPRIDWDFQLLWIGSAISVLGSRVSGIAFPLLVLALNGSASEAGMVGFAGTLPSVLFQLPAGVLVDRWHRKRVMIVCDVGRGLAVTSVVLALIFGTPSVIHLMAVSFIEGTLSIFYGLCESGAVRALIPSERLGTALSQVEARERGAGLLGRPLGGFLYGTNRVLPFVFDALSYAVNLITLLLIRKELQKERPAAPSGERRRFIDEVGAGLVWLWRQPFLRAAAFLVAGSNMLFQIIFLMVIILAKGQGASPTTIGFMLTGSGIGGLLGSLVAPWCERRFPRRAVVIGVNWIWAVLMLLLAMADDIYVIGILLGLMTFVGPIWNVAIMVYQLSIIPEDLLGRVQSASGLLAHGTIPLGALLGGYMLDSVGGRTTAFAVAAFMFLVSLASTMSPAVRGVSTVVPARPSVGLSK